MKKAYFFEIYRIIGVHEAQEFCILAKDDKEAIEMYKEYQEVIGETIVLFCSSWLKNSKGEIIFESLSKNKSTIFDEKTRGRNK